MAYLNLIGEVEMLEAYRLPAHPFTMLVAPGGQVFRTYLGYTDKEVAARHFVHLYYQ